MPTPLPSDSTTPLPYQLPVRLRPGEGVVIANADPIGAELCLEVGQVQHHRMLGAQQRLLILAGSVEVVIDGQMRGYPVDLIAACRLFAFHDHCCNVDRAPARPLEEPVCLATMNQIEGRDAFVSWLLASLVSGGQDMDRVAEACQRDEAYQLIRFILQHDGRTSIEEVAGRYGLSASHFRRKCKLALGRPLKQELRLLRAARMLLAYPGRGVTLTHLAEDHGYASLSHFSGDAKALLGNSVSHIYDVALKRPQ